MDEPSLRALLGAVASGQVAPDDAVRRLRRLPYADLGFAKVDHHRYLRQGQAEAVYGPGKTPGQAAAIVAELLAEPQGGPVILTRADPDQVTAAGRAAPGGRVYEPGPAGLATVVWRARPARRDSVLVVTAGTADLPVATEAVATLEAYGFRPDQLVDCGVAGLHRLLGAVDQLQTAEAVIVVAGMEGALASLVGGIAAAPVVAVPTSVGYGAGLQGVTALLAMMASCAAGVTVVGIDNGFGAGSAVARWLDPSRDPDLLAAGAETGDG